jgi:acyl-CoA reductase-like NAD-dependent aldehyde dehydrogenase
MMNVESMSQILARGRIAQKAWKAISVKQRLVYIQKLRKDLVAQEEMWVKLFAEETRKTPVDVITTELLFTAQACLFYEKKAERMLKSRRMPTPIHFLGQRSYVRNEPLGLIAIISPWNFPLQLSMVPVISAVIAGNAVVLKPSEYTPKINEALEKWISDSGLPQHLIQFVHGDGHIGEMLIDAKPDKVFFTGGGLAGNKVYERAAKWMIPCDLELGGNDAMIVCQDAHLERAVQAAAWGAFLHSGQVCISVERVYVHQSKVELFIQQVTALAQSLKQGLAEDDDVGGMSTEAGWLKNKNFLEDALEKGAVIHTGGLTSDSVPPFFPPTILSQVSEEMKVLQHEIFGPMLLIIPFEDEFEVIKQINRSPLGLNGYIFSQNIKKAKQLAEQLEVGNCYINDVIMNISNMNLPFGGVKSSGFGRYHGVEGLLTFSIQKSVMVDRGYLRKQIHWFPYGKKAYPILKRVLKYMYG